MQNWKRNKDSPLLRLLWNVFPCKGLNPGLFLVVSNKKRNMYIVFLPSGEFPWKARMRTTYLNSCPNTYN